MDTKNIKKYALLHAVFLIYSFCGVCSKAAAGYPFLSLKFCIFYGLNILVLFFYAIAWQQIIKRMPLTSAFANKGVTIIWAMIWGRLFFSEQITVNKVIGVVLVVTGIVLFANADKGEENG